MRPIIPLAILALASLSLYAGPAFAGGIGIVTTAGLHGDRVYSYEEDVNGVATQMDPEDQLNSNFGGGLEIVLGDKDLKIMGIFRGYYLQDAPQQEPKNGPIFNVRDVPRDLGVINAGLQWGILGDPGALQLTVVGTLGAGVFTNDFTGYALAEAGVGGTWMAARRIQVAASVTGGARYRKRFYPTTNVYLGARVLFD
ncbi:MAG: hypothetical protein Q8P18_25915 [Pseudomonadota bacterium]|nr:hypothetical protein [Pseudomonadota bacterium]